MKIFISAIIILLTTSFTPSFNPKEECINIVLKLDDVRFHQLSIRLISEEDEKDAVSKIIGDKNNQEILQKIWWTKVIDNEVKFDLIFQLKNDDVSFYNLNNISKKDHLRLLLILNLKSRKIKYKYYKI